MWCMSVGSPWDVNLPCASTVHAAQLDKARDVMKLSLDLDESAKSHQA